VALPHRWDKVAADVAAAERAAAAKLLADKRAAKEAAEEELRRRCTALGLLQALTEANVADNKILKKAIAFFDEQGIPSVSEMVKYDMVDEFISHLGLKAFPGRKLRSMLLPPTSSLATHINSTRTHSRNERVVSESEREHERRVEHYRRMEWYYDSDSD